MSHDDDDDIVVIRIVADVLQFELTYDKSAEIYGFDKNRRHRYDIITRCCSIIHRFNIKRWPATDSAIRGFSMPRCTMPRGNDHRSGAVAVAGDVRPLTAASAVCALSRTAVGDSVVS